MSRRIDIELTSTRADGTWTWRAAGAQKPKGVLDGALLPAGAAVGQVLKAEADALMSEREPGDVQFDEESGEGDSLAVERERDLALSAQARAAVELIDAALARVEAGTYGDRKSTRLNSSH